MERIERFTVLGARSEPLRMAAVMIPWTELTHHRTVLAGIAPLREVMACYEITQGARRVADAIVYACPEGIMFRLAPFAPATAPATVWERAMPAGTTVGELVTAWWAEATTELRRPAPYGEMRPAHFDDLTSE